MIFGILGKFGIGIGNPKNVGRKNVYRKKTFRKLLVEKKVGRFFCWSKKILVDFFSSQFSMKKLLVRIFCPNVFGAQNVGPTIFVPEKICPIFFGPKMFGAEHGDVASRQASYQLFNSLAVN